MKNTVATFFVQNSIYEWPLTRILKEKKCWNENKKYKNQVKTSHCSELF